MDVVLQPHFQSVGVEMAVGQNQWYHFGVGAPPILLYFSGDLDVQRGYNLDFDPRPPFNGSTFVRIFLEKRLPKGHLDGHPKRSPPSPIELPEASGGTDSPLVLDQRDCLVLQKPSGWETYGGADADPRSPVA